MLRLFLNPRLSSEARRPFGVEDRGMMVLRQLLRRASETRVIELPALLGPLDAET
jgi:hypothetical protein